ncbi:MAG: acyltransferase [Pseudomonadota bacterium]
MLGIFRYILAVMVAISHFTKDFLWWQGAYAVFSFYTISGYLMCLVLNESYLGGKGKLYYLANRILRIFPAYWTAFLAAVFLYFVYGGIDFSVSRYGLLYQQINPVPGDLPSLLGNITLLWPWDTQLAISQAWSLRIELVFYVLMVFLTKSFRVVFAWIAVSIGLVWLMALSSTPFLERYTSLTGSSFAFSIGAGVYFMRRYFRLSTVHIYAASAAFIAHLILAPYLWGFDRHYSGFADFFARETLGLYGSTVLGAYLLWAILDQLPKHSEHRTIKSVDRYLGKIAYAVFLCHWIAASIVVAAGVDSLNMAVYVPAAFITTNILAIGLYQFVERPIESTIRMNIRHRVGK